MDERNIEYLRLFTEGRGLAPGSVESYRMLLNQLDRFHAGKDFKLIVEEDMRRWIRTRRVKENTMNREKVLLKNFFRHLHGFRKYTYPPVVDWLVRRSSTNKLPVVNANDLLSEDEVKQLLECSTSSRDRALWMALFEGGLRISEGLGLDVGSLVFDEYGCYALVDGKTGQRRVRFVQATPYLREYLNLHPGRDDPTCPLWVAEGSKRRLHGSSVRRSLSRILKRSGLKKRVWPHLFRHSRGTINAKFMTEAELNVFMGWRQGSKQSAAYVHLDGSDLDEKILSHLGLFNGEQEKPGEEALKPISCPRCDMANPATSRFCFKCSAALTMEVALQLEQKRHEEIEALKGALGELRGELESFRTVTPVMDKLFSDIEFKALLTKKLRDMKT